MSELLIKFNQLDEVQREEVLDFINFLLTKRQKKKEAVEEVEETYNFFDSAGLMENRDIDANQLRREAWKTNP